MKRKLIEGRIPYESEFYHVRTLDPPDEYLERLGALCFHTSIRRGDVIQLRVSHDVHTYASTADGSLQVWDDPTGVSFSFYGDLSHRPTEALYKAAQAREFRGVSPAWQTRLDEYDAEGRRTILVGTLVEISLCALCPPACPFCTYSAQPLMEEMLCSLKPKIQDPSSTSRHFRPSPAPA
jgi:phage head maturation protease